MTKKVEILGVYVHNVSFAEALDYLKNNMDFGERTLAVTPNSEMLLYASKNQEFKNILKGSDLVVPDGAGVILASRMIGQSLKERVAGVDLVSSLLEAGNQRGSNFYFLGGTPEVAEKVEKKINRDYPGLNLKTHHGYFEKEQEKDIIEELKNNQFDVLFVGMGTPRQEKWLYKNLPFLNVTIGMGIGGSFDVITGEKKRAPRVMQKLYLEWLFRLAQEPARIWRMKALPLFLIKVLKEKIL